MIADVLRTCVVLFER